MENVSVVIMTRGKFENVSFIVVLSDLVAEYSSRGWHGKRL